MIFDDFWWFLTFLTFFTFFTIFCVFFWNFVQKNIYKPIIICTHITSTPSTSIHKPRSQEIPKSEISHQTLFRNHCLDTQAQSLESQIPKESSLFTHTIQRPTLRTSKSVQEPLHQLCPQTSTNSCPPNRSPNLWSLSDSFQKPSLHTSPISGISCSQRVLSFSHTIQRPNSENLQECSRALTPTLSPNLHKLMSPKQIPKSVISIRLFSGFLLHTQVQSLDLRDPQRVISSHTQFRDPSLGSRVFKSLTSTLSINLHKLQVSKKILKFEKHL